MHIQSILATPLARFPARWFPTIEAVLGYSRQHSRENAHNRTSSETRILDQYDNFMPLKLYIQSALAEYCQRVLALNSAELVITQSWLNFNEPGDSHHLHRHLNSVISGVYYITEGNNVIEFQSSQSGNLQFGEQSLLRDVEQLQCQRGELILFPSWTPHSVPRNTENHRRITLSFNTQLRGYLGSEQELTGCEF